MVMQQLPSRGEASQVYTDKGEHVAIYSMAPITPEEVNHLPTCNYQFCDKARGKVHHYSADSYDGSNIGRFNNQCSLLPAFRWMVAASRQYLHPSLQARAVEEEETDKHCNVCYPLGPRRELLVEMKEGCTWEESTKSYSQMVAFCHTYCVPC